MTGWLCPDWSLRQWRARALSQVLACLAHRHARPAGRGADVGDRREQRVLPEVIGLPPGNLLQQVRFGPALEGGRGQYRVLELRVLPAAKLIIWHLLKNPEARFTDLGYGYYQARTDTDRKLKNHIRQIQAPGFDVTVTRAA
jgi:hypothetical protein